MSERGVCQTQRDKSLEQKIDVRIFDNHSSTEDNDEADIILSNRDDRSQNDTVNQSNQVRESKVR